jgi:hypothetical protein
VGGIGSGNRWRYGTRDKCESSLRIDIRYMRTKGLLTRGTQGTLSWSRGGETTSWINYKCHEATLELDYRTRPTGGDWTPVNEHISIERAAQPFGGTRRYFRCPHCYGRCLVLYGGSRFRCRKCQNLAYASQNQDLHDRASAKARKIRERLGDVGCFDDPFPSKPKGMHWRTYEKLERECERYENQVAVQMMHVLGRLEGRFGRV